ncbi:ABC transporter-like protein [Burkholderia multivorans]|uniref:ABC transporter ATP-binding protein/permease n=1 Tax=Burkholderia multivorans TaxID=87883 RepID=UPI0006A59594|nr:ABC transporter ATP-binding protein [Burkholderia multivorans]KOE24691.1 ABC transporter [Burkholderia multivorans R-20526]MBU9244343.1 ABC transporter ATP-binding protein/permease [Burkholderia multivorans]MCO7338277.1 ABC transporter ATP-binding protein/permease [Burkholderia multivorans]MCO7340700.1 ABC transporter ATP-binding protein/permease [Burkholderia multivorans]MCO7347436.1 ABC transporter ATP-binding protein/permease [Burkholderia multivorans]
MQRHLWRLAGVVYADIAISVAIGLAVTACYAGQALCLALGIAAIWSGASLRGLSGWAFGFAAFALARIALMWAGEVAALRTASRTKARLRARLLPQALALGAHGGAGRTAELQHAIVGGVEALETYYGRYIPAVCVALVGCAAVIGAVAWIDPLSAGVLAACVFAVPVIDRVWLRLCRPRASGLMASIGRFGATMLDSLQGIATLKAFDAAGSRRASLIAAAAGLRREAMGILYATLMRNGVTGLFGLGCVAAVAAFNASRAASGVLPATTALITLFLAREAFRPVDRLDKTFHIAWGAASAAGPIASLLDAEPPVREPVSPRAPGEHADVVFDDVTFTWPGSDRPALKHVSLTIGQREFVGIVGPSGAGKSTLGALLIRMADPQHGSVRIGGVDLRDLPLAAMREKVGAVFQDIVLFDGSIEDNLRFARPDADADAIRDAARVAHVHDFIEGLPQGYATPVGERAAQLSGGQRQRLAIARAWLKGAPILLLDEAASNVDPSSEQAIQASIEACAGQRALVVIAHRLATVRHADRIVVVDDGRIVEEGDHDTLKARGGLYARLLAAQAGETGEESV